MRGVLLAAAAVALMTGAAPAQDKTEARAAPDGAVNPEGHAPSGVDAAGPAGIVPFSALAAGANSFTEAQARARLEGAGFAAISELHQDDRGIWRAQAVRGGADVGVGFDYKGNIAVQ